MASSDIKILILGKVWPEPNSSAAGSRMMQLIECFLGQGWNVTFASSASKSGHETDLKTLGIFEEFIKLNSSSFEDLVDSLQPDIVLFDRFMTEEQFGWRVAERCPDAVRILDTEDLHCLRKARYQSWKTGEEVDVRSIDVAKREIASILRSDLSLIISAYEMKLLKKVFKIDESLLLHLPFMLEALKEESVNNWLSFDNRDHFISIGNFLHEPNWNAVLYLKQELWPAIREQLPQTELHIYGAYPSQKVEQLHNPGEGFLVKGRAGNAKEVVGKARVLLAPIRFGAGLKGKLIEAMQCGTPSVTTTIGAEAMHGSLPWPGGIKDDPKEFAEAAVQLYQDEQKWMEAQQAGIPVINSLYDKTELGDKLIKSINELLSILEAHRKQNFLGAMLQHHTAASTKFMSKWIELKNDR
ncbi:MAG: glycosyltransferase [Balneola sp.]|nr:glycosyltransferase [Balneola sp.]|tara:strand:- start:199558 stop:200796 length:1239 start_codon:yes stop_codon:yes gene_type:complete